mgnify:CR=1 FL=1|tara:strand:- start:111 stop:467 length:357 start_codon:yes stop_codon:yes gene_type:complete
MLQSNLEALVASTQDAMGAAVLNLDGVVIDAYDGTGLDPEPAHALPEFGQVIRQLRAVNETFSVGDMVSTEVRGADRITLLRPLNEHYLLAMWIRPNALVPQAKFRLRVAAPDVALQL